ncbi:hypothetical protein L9F63_009621, partial [Diploptera punctata]
DRSEMRPEEEESVSGASSGGGEDVNLQEVLQDGLENAKSEEKPRDPERSRDLFGIQLEV